MDQQILATKKSRFIVRPITSLGGQNRSKSGMLKNFRVTDSQCQTLLVGMDTLLLLAGLLIAWQLAQLSTNTHIAISSLSLRTLELFWVGMLLGTWLLFGWLTDL